MYIRLFSYFLFLTAFVPVKAQDELPEQVTVAHRMEAELSEMGGVYRFLVGTILI